jgi:hypothetical protein
MNGVREFPPASNVVEIAGADVAAMQASAPDALSQGKTIIMMLSTASINDTQRVRLERYAAMFEKDWGAASTPN